jgi:protein-disulfide isomerase
LTEAGEHPLKVPVSEQDWSRGPADAPVMLVEYADFQCPACGRAHPVIAQLAARYPDRVRWVFRHFPLASSHPRALPAAIAAEAAGAQGRFWEMHDLLFENQGRLEDDHLIEYARRIGLDLDRFRADLRRRLNENKIREQLRQGARSGVNGTPTIFIDGQRYDGPRTLEALAAAVGAEDRG